MVAEVIHETHTHSTGTQLPVMEWMRWSSGGGWEDVTGVPFAWRWWLPGVSRTPERTPGPLEWDPSTCGGSWRRSWECCEKMRSGGWGEWCTGTQWRCLDRGSRDGSDHWIKDCTCRVWFLEVHGQKAWAARCWVAFWTWGRGRYSGMRLDIVR